MRIVFVIIDLISPKKLLTNRLLTVLYRLNKSYPWIFNKTSQSPFYLSKEQQRSIYYILIVFVINQRVIRLIYINKDHEFSHLIAPRYFYLLQVSAKYPRFDDPAHRLINLMSLLDHQNKLTARKGIETLWIYPLQTLQLHQRK